MSEFLASAGAIGASFFGWCSEVLTFIVDTPLLLALCSIGIIGVVIGVVKGFVKAA